MSRNIFFGCAAACALLTLAASPLSAKKGPVFQKLVDTSFLAPDGQPIFTIDRPAMAGSNVVFIAATGTPNAYLFGMSSGDKTPRDLVDNNTKVPDGTGNFTGSFAGYFTTFEPPTCSSPGVGTKDVAFVGRDAAGNEGVYSVPIKGGKVKMLADYKTLIPGGPVNGYQTFNVNYSFCNISISGTTVVFDAGGSGVYKVSTTGKDLARVADPNTPATVKDFIVNQYLQPTISGENIVFVGATVFGPYAIFKGTSLGVLARAKRDSFDGFAFPIINGNDLDYVAHLTFPNQGLFRTTTDGAASTKIMDFNTKLPAGTPGTSFSAIGSTSNGQNWAPAGKLNVIAAQTTDGTNNYPVLFSSCKAKKLAKVLAAGDTLDGVTDIQPGAGVSNLIAQDDGTYTGAILVTGSRYAAIYTVNIPGC